MKFRIVQCTLMVFIFACYFCLAKGMHKYEYKENTFYLILYISAIVVIAGTIVTFDYILYGKLDHIINGLNIDMPDEVAKYTLQYDKWTVYIMILEYFSWMLTPLILLLFKKNQDMFSSFSKIDNMAMITIFQEPFDEEQGKDIDQSSRSPTSRGARKEYERRVSKYREDLMNK